MEPSVEERLDINFAVLCCLFYNANRGKGKPDKQPKDFLIEWDKRNQKPADSRAAAR